MMRSHGMIGRSICRQGQTNHYRLCRLRQLGMGRYAVRGRCAAIQKADLRNALRRSERSLRGLRRLLRRQLLERREVRDFVESLMDKLPLFRYWNGGSVLNSCIIFLELVLRILTLYRFISHNRHKYMTVRATTMDKGSSLDCPVYNHSYS